MCRSTNQPLPSFAIDVVAERQRELRSCSDDAWKAHNGKNTEQYVDDFVDGRARAHRGIGVRPVGSHRAAHRDQRCESDERFRLGFELAGADWHLPGTVLGKAGVVYGESAQSFHVVHEPIPPVRPD